MRTLIYKLCPTASNGNRTTEVYWDSTIRDEVHTTPPNASVCSLYYIPENTLLDSWFEGSTRVDAFSRGTLGGRPERPAYYLTYTPNAPGGGDTPCGLKIDDVQVSGSGSEYIITIFTSGYSGAVEYSLNQFTDVQDSNVFRVLPGSYIAYARAKR